MAFNSEEQNKRRDPRHRRRSHPKSGLKILLILLAVIALLSVAVVFCVKWGLLPLEGDKSPGGTRPPETEPPGDTVIHFVAGGDLNVTEHTLAAGKTDSGLDFTRAFMDVAPLLAGADAAALNLEGVLYGSQPCAAPPELMQAIDAAGIDLVQMANSYSIVEGIRGLQASLSGIRNAGMEPLGAYGSNEEFQKTGGFTLWEIQGIKVAFVAFTKGMDGMGLPAGSENCVNLLYTDYNSTYQKVDTEGIRRVLQAAKAQKPDITIAMVHWGSEYNNQISATQEKITRLMQDEGVDAIVGTHSHYVQKMEFDPEKGSFVAYSLGDFFGNADKAGTNYSVLLDLEITKNGATGETKITSFDYIPIFIDRPGEDGTGMRVLRIREAMEGYESNYLGKVSEQTYNAMSEALKHIESRVNPKK